MSELLSLLYCFIVLSLILWSGRGGRTAPTTEQTEDLGSEVIRQTGYLLLTGMLLLLFGNGFYISAMVVITVTVSGAFTSGKRAGLNTTVRMRVAGILFILFLVLLPMLYLLFFVLVESGSTSAVKPGTLLLILPALALAVFGKRVLKTFYQYLLFSVLLVIAAIISGQFYTAGITDIPGGMVTPAMQYSGTALVLLALVVVTAVRQEPDAQAPHVTLQQGMSAAAVVFFLFILSHQKLLVNSMLTGFVENSPAAWSLLHVMISIFITVYVQMLSEIAEELSEINQQAAKKVFRGERTITYTITVLIIASGLLLSTILCIRTDVMGTGGVTAVATLFSVYLLYRLVSEQGSGSFFRIVRGMVVSGIILLGVVLPVLLKNSMEIHGLFLLFFSAVLLLHISRIQAFPVLLRRFRAVGLMRIRNSLNK